MRVEFPGPESPPVGEDSLLDDFAGWSESDVCDPDSKCPHRGRVESEQSGPHQAQDGRDCDIVLLCPVLAGDRCHGVVEFVGATGYEVELCQLRDLELFVCHSGLRKGYGKELVPVDDHVGLEQIVHVIGGHGFLAFACVYPDALLPRIFPGADELDSRSKRVSQVAL